MFLFFALFFALCFTCALTLNEFLLFLCLFELCSCSFGPFRNTLTLLLVSSLLSSSLLFSSLLVLFWHSVLLAHCDCCCLCCCCCLNKTKLVYPFLLSNISGWSRVFAAMALPKLTSAMPHGAVLVHCQFLFALPSSPSPSLSLPLPSSLSPSLSGTRRNSRPVTIFHAVVSFCSLSQLARSLSSLVLSACYALFTLLLLPLLLALIFLCLFRHGSVCFFRSAGKRCVYYV